jgi:hypothetical protein
MDTAYHVDYPPRRGHHKRVAAFGHVGDVRVSITYVIRVFRSQLLKHLDQRRSIIDGRDKDRRSDLATKHNKRVPQNDPIKAPLIKVIYGVSSSNNRP